MEPDAEPVDTTAEHQPIRGPRINQGLVILDIGAGKGKTTAALGVMLRAWGRDMQVRMFEFVDRTVDGQSDHVAAARSGIAIHALRSGPDPDRVHAQWAVASVAIVDGDDDVVVLDDLTVMVEADALALTDLIATLRRRPPMRHVIITGPRAPDGLVEFADLVTEMRVVKAPSAEAATRIRGLTW